MPAGRRLVDGALYSGLRLGGKRHGLRRVDVLHAATEAMGCVAQTDSQFYDVAPLPRLNGCPVRSRFAAVLLSTAEILVTAEPVRDEPMFRVSGPWRACLRTTGADPVLGDRAEGDMDLLAGIAGDWLLIDHSAATATTATTGG